LLKVGCAIKKNDKLQSYEDTNSFALTDKLIMWIKHLKLGLHQFMVALQGVFISWNIPLQWQTQHTV